MRSFISLNISSRAKREIKTICDGLKKKIGTNAQVRYDNPDNYHITLFFIGEINEGSLKKIYDVLKERLSGRFGELNFVCEDYGGFPNLKNPRVIFLDSRNIENKIFEIAAVVDGVLSEYGFPRDKKFHPHITLARIKSRIDLEKLSNEKVDVNFSVSKISIMQSIISTKGAEHKEIFAINL